MANIVELENSLGLGAGDLTPEELASYESDMRRQLELEQAIELARTVESIGQKPRVSSADLEAEQQMLMERAFSVLDAAQARKGAGAAVEEMAVETAPAPPQRSPQNAARELAVQKIMGAPAPSALEESAAGQSLMGGMSTMGGQSEADLLRDIIPSIPVSDDVTGQSVTFEPEEIVVGPQMTFAQASKSPDLSGMSEATIIDRALAVGIPNEEYVRRHIAERRGEEAARLLGGADREIGMDLIKDAKDLSPFVSMVDDAEMKDENYFPFGMMRDNFGEITAPSSSSLPREDVIADMSKFGEVTAPSTASLLKQRQRKSGAPAESALKQAMAAAQGETRRKPIALREGGLGSAEPAGRAEQGYVRAADNILEGMMAEQNQAKEYMQLMPSIDMLRRQIQGMGRPDQSLADLERRIKSASSAGELFGLDADVRNVGSDVAASRDALVDALGVGAGTVQNILELESSKPAQRKSMAKEMFASMEDSELMSYGDDFKDYIEERPEVRIAYSNALKEAKKKLRIMSREDAQNKLDYLERIKRIEKMEAEIKGVGALTGKRRAEAAKARRSGRGSSKQDVKILENTYDGLRKSIEAELKGAQGQLKTLLGSRQEGLDATQVRDLQKQIRGLEGLLAQADNDRTKAIAALRNGKPLQEVLAETIPGRMKKPQPR